MTPPPLKRPPTVGPFPLGVNNRRPPHDLTKVVGNAPVDLLRDAVNVDVSDNGKLRRRQGFSQVFTGRSHSAWGDDSQGFYVEGSTLYHLSLGDVLQRRTVRDDLAPGMPLSYCEAGGTHYYTNTQVLGMVRDGFRMDFTPQMLLTPKLSAIGGALTPGRYQLCFTQIGPSGESAATQPQAVALPQGGGIRVSEVPIPAAGCSIRFYMTGVDGEVFGRVDASITGGVAEIVAPPAMGAPCQTLLLEPMPPGSIVRWSNGRLLVAVDNLLIYSEPFFPGLWNPSKNYIPFPAPITLIVPCGGGIFVAADKTYWLQGEITAASLAEVLPYGAVPHSDGTDPAEADSVFWISDRGLVRGTADGSAKNIQEDQLALAGGAAGASVLREHDGQRHILTSTQDPGHTVAGFGARFDAEIIRKGASQ